MIYTAGERVDFRPLTSEHPDSCVFQLTDGDGHAVMRALTVANGGLVLRRKGAVHPVFHVPRETGRYGYRFWDSEQVTSGEIRVVPAPPPPARPPEPLAPPRRRYTGPGAR